MEHKWFSTIFIWMFLVFFLINFLREFEYDNYAITQYFQSRGYSLFMGKANFLPIFPVLIYPSVLFFGSQGARYLSMLSGLLLWIMTYKLGRVFYSVEDASLFTMFTMFNPLIIVYSASGISEIFFTLMLLASIYFLLKKSFHFVTVTFVTAMLTRYEAWFLIPFMLCLIWRSTTKIENKMRFTTAITLSVIFWHLLNYWQYSTPFHYVETSMWITSFWKGDVLGWMNIPEQIKIIAKLSIFTVLYPLFLTTFFWLFSFKNSVNSNLKLIILSFPAFLTVGSLIGVTWEWARYLIPIIPLTMLSGFTRFMKLSPKKKLAVTLIYFSIATVATVQQINLAYIWLSKIMG